jgi:serine/threonine protein kinase
MPADSRSERLPSIFPGATIAGRFRLERLLGRGSMGSVWLARHLTLDVDVAVKFIDAAFRDQKDHRGRFALEAQAAARINSPHVVNVLDFGTEDSGRLYIAMEYLEGEDLGKLLERSGGKLPLQTTARIMSHACRGLGRAHALGISHRDIKPENLFLCGDASEDDFVLKVLDFGVAKSNGESGVDLVATTAGQLVGSPAYMSPEQARGSLDVDFRSDLFSLAVVTYHCLTGSFAFGGDSLTDLLVGIVSKDPTPATRFVPSLPRTIDDWFSRALQKKPAERFQSAKDFAQAFQMAIGQQSSSASDYASSGTILSRTVVDLSPTSEVTASASPVSRAPRTSALSVSNQTPSPGVAQVLAQLAEVASVLGAALVGPEGDAVAHHSLLGLPPTTFADVARSAHSSLGAFESLEASASQALALYFESATVLVRWVEGHALVVVGTEQVHPTVLSVSLNAAAAKLLTLAKQGGGASHAFRATSSGASDAEPSELSLGVAQPPALTDPVTDSIITRLTQLFAKPLGAVGRLAIQQRLKGGKPTGAGFADFVKRLAILIEDETEREAFLDEALLLVPAPALPAERESNPQFDSDAASKPKRVVVYRGHKVEE